MKTNKPHLFVQKASTCFNPETFNIISGNYLAFNLKLNLQIS